MDEHIAKDLETVAHSTLAGWTFLIYTAQVLGGDVERCVANLERTNGELSQHSAPHIGPDGEIPKEIILEGRPIYDELCFWHRSLVRAFVSQVDGMLYLMKYLILQAADRGEVVLTRGETQLLDVNDYRLNRAMVSAFPKNTRLLEDFRLVFTYYPQVLGLDLGIDYSHHGWERFQTVLTSRNSFVHPKSARIYWTAPDKEPVITAIRWFHIQMASLSESYQSRPR